MPYLCQAFLLDGLDAAMLRLAEAIIFRFSTLSMAPDDVQIVPCHEDFVADDDGNGDEAEPDEEGDEADERSIGDTDGRDV